jgi:hypothetical protein
MKIEEGKEREIYVKPEVLATYKKEELEEIIKPHGPVAQSPVEPGIA